jgi:hypothetical protein
MEIIWFKYANEFTDLRINFGRHNVRELYFQNLVTELCLDYSNYIIEY